MEPILRVDGVTKSFEIPSERRDTVREHVLGLFRPRRHETLRVLDGLSFEVRPGETLGIMGKNGCGKSTLLKIVCGVYPPDRGRVEARAPMTPILQLGVGWNPELDAVDNVLLLGAVMGMSLAELHSKLDEILAFAEVERFANLELKHYSSGMASRLSYAVAFHSVREILVLDEIFAVGDAGFKAKCETRFAELHAAGHTAVVVSHDARIVSTFCQRALLMDGGKVVAEGSGADVAAAYVRRLRPE